MQVMHVQDSGHGRDGALDGRHVHAGGGTFEQNVDAFGEDAPRAPENQAADDEDFAQQTHRPVRLSGRVLGGKIIC